MKKKNTLNLVLNEIKKDVNDPTIIPCTFVILDFDVSRNNVKISEDDALEGGKTLINKPIVAKYYQVSQANANDDNFGSHAEYRTKDKYGNDVILRDTVAVGVFTSEGYITQINVNGENKRVMVADGVLWYSKYKDACDLIVEWYNRGVQVNMSCEYLYYNYSILDGVEHHLSPIIFESHAILASEDRGNISEVIPAYESATLLSLNDLQKFNTLVAQAANQVKEENSVDELSQGTEIQEGIEDTKEEIAVDVPEGQQLNEMKSQINEVSMDEMRRAIREQVKGIVQQNDYVWIYDVYQTYAIVSVEDYDSNKSEFYKFNYTLENDTVTVDLESKTEVKEKREWVVVTNELETKITELTNAKADLEVKFNAASDTIVSLKSQIEELTPYREQQLNAQREKALEDQMKHFCAKFDAVDAKEKFESEEVQSLIAQSIEDNDAAKEALLSLNVMIVELIQEQVTENAQEIPMLGLASYRKDLINTDSFESRYKL